MLANFGIGTLACTKISLCDRPRRRMIVRSPRSRIKPPPRCVRDAPACAGHDDEWPHAPRLHHSGLGAIRADADQGAAGRPAGRGFPGTRDPLALAGATLYLPTRRACRLVRDSFLEVTAGRRRDPAADRRHRRHRRGRDRVRADAATGPIAADALELPQALGGLERRHAAGATGPANGHAGSRPTARRGGAGRQQPGLRARARRRSRASHGRHDDARKCRGTDSTNWCPDELDRYWQLTLEFLKIARESWPAILAAARQDRAGRAARRADRGGSGAACRARRRAGDRRRLDRLDAGDRRAARDHRQAAARRRGAARPRHRSDDAVLGADRRRQDAAGRDRRAALGHPQFAMQALLRRIGMAREEVIALAEPAAHGRERWCREALRPAAATDRWQQRCDRDFAGAIERALEQLARDRSRQRRGGSAGDRGRAARGGRNARARPPRWSRPIARSPAACWRRSARWNVAVDDSGGDALRRYVGRAVRAARGRGRARRSSAGDACWRCSSIRCCGSARVEGAHDRARSRARAGGAARPAPAARHGRAGACAGEASALSWRSCGAGNHPTCIPPIRASSSEADSRRRPLGRAARRGVGATRNLAPRAAPLSPRWQPAIAMSSRR